MINFHFHLIREIHEKIINQLIKAVSKKKSFILQSLMTLMHIIIQFKVFTLHFDNTFFTFIITPPTLMYVCM